ncbi:hypothetical protein [Streptomyces sp. NPDC094049]|uniref:hypothetical protein n=1 Tax=Streptomyces sp. NPDC094049 TaxID=3154987 RepID=UPI003332619F
MVALLAGTAPALAEGSWTSYIKDWRDNNESRRWEDKQIDEASTTVTFANCSDAFSMDTGLYRVVDNWPDTGYGGKVNQCATSNWGKISTSGKFYFKKLSGGVVSVGNVTVRY